MTGRARAGSRKISQRIELSEREHKMLVAISEVNEENYAEVFRRLLRDEYRYLVTNNFIDGPLVIRNDKERK